MPESALEAAEGLVGERPLDAAPQDADSSPIRLTSPPKENIENIGASIAHLVAQGREALFDAMVTAFEGDPAHKCMGRSAPARLKRALEHAAAHGLETPALKRIAQQTGND